MSVLQTFAVLMAEKLEKRRDFFSQDGCRWYRQDKPDHLCVEAAAELRRLAAIEAEVEGLRTLAAGRLEQMNADRQQALEWKRDAQRNSAIDCRVINGDRSVIISQTTASDAFSLMKKEAAERNNWQSLPIDDRSFKRASLHELEKAHGIVAQPTPYQPPTFEQEPNT